MVKPGYKQTEIGTIPEDWNVKKLGDIATVSRGASPRPIDDPIWFDEKSNVGWVRISDVTKASKYLLNTVQKLSCDGIKKSRPVVKNNLIMSICATVGRPIITKIDVCIHDGFVVFDNLHANPEYVYYYLSSIENNWSKHGQTGSQMNLNTSIINNEVIPFPPTKAEQFAIARVLSDVDALVESLDVLIAKKKSIKQGAMQQLLTGKKRLLGFKNSSNYKQTEIGIIPGDWEFKKFEDVMDGFSSGQTPHRAHPEYYKGNTPWITSGELNYNVIINTIEKITTEGMCAANLKLIPKGTFLFAITGLEAEGTRGACAITGVDATTNQSCMALYPKKGVLTTDYLYHYYVKNGKALALKYCQGTKQQSYTGGTAKLLPIIIPPTIEEQFAISRVLSDMDVEIKELERKRDKCRLVKVGMMQELLTGRIRLK